MESEKSGLLQLALIETEGHVWRGWSRRWPLILSTAWALVVTGFVGLWWFVGERTSENDFLIRFFDSLVGIGSFSLAGAITIATIYSATRSGHAVKLTEAREASARVEKKKGRINALVGASLEAASYGLWMAEIQRRGLKPWRRFIPESEIQRQFAIVSWRQLSAAAVAASKALEQIRYEDPDLLDLAGDHFDVVVELQQAAFEGDPEYLQTSARRIRESADRLWAAV